VVSGLAADGIPAVALRAYRNAVGRSAVTDPACGLPWTLLAAIGRIESDHGRFANAILYDDGLSVPPVIGIALNGVGTEVVTDTDQGRLDGDRVYDRAVGPMQFIPSTWAIYGADGNADGHKDPFNIFDAAAAAGHYLCTAGGNLRTTAGQTAAVLAYNHSDSYLASVLALEATYAGSGVGPAVPPVGPAPPGGPAAAVPMPPPVDPGPPLGLPTPLSRHPTPLSTRSAPQSTHPSSVQPSSTQPSSTQPNSTQPSATPTPAYSTDTATPTPTPSQTVACVPASPSLTPTGSTTAAGSPGVAGSVNNPPIAAVEASLTGTGTSSAAASDTATSAASGPPTSPGLSGSPSVPPPATVNC
jgi:hypothetical protein